MSFSFFQQLSSVPVNQKQRGTVGYSVCVTLFLVLAERKSPSTQLHYLSFLWCYSTFRSNQVKFFVFLIEQMFSKTQLWASLNHICPVQPAAGAYFKLSYVSLWHAEQFERLCTWQYRHIIVAKTMIFSCFCVWQIYVHLNLPLNV